MSDSILDTVKKVVGIDPDYTAFDLDIMMHINTVFSDLHQLGVGPEAGFEVTTKNDKWSDFIGTSPVVNNVKTYTYLRVKLLFDPPPTSFALDAMKQQIEELAWRINVYREEVKHPWQPPLTEPL